MSQHSTPSTSTVATATIALAKILCERQINSNRRANTCDYIWSPVWHNRTHTRTRARCRTFSNVNQIYLSVNLCLSLRCNPRERDATDPPPNPKTHTLTHDQTSKLHFKTNDPICNDKMYEDDRTNVPMKHKHWTRGVVKSGTRERVCAKYLGNRD